jgi:hypothetical protein
LNGLDPEPRHFRTLIHEPEYDQALERIYKDLWRADDIVAGLDFWISRRAEDCYAVEGYPPKGFAFWLSKRTREGRIRVIFSYDDETVHLITAWLIPDHLEGLFH